MQPLTILPRSRPRFAYSPDGEGGVTIIDTYRNLTVRVTCWHGEATQQRLATYFPPGTPVTDGNGRQGRLSSRGEFMPGCLFSNQQE